MREVYL